MPCSRLTRSPVGILIRKANEAPGITSICQSMGQGHEMWHLETKSICRLMGHGHDSDRIPSTVDGSSPPSATAGVLPEAVAMCPSRAALAGPRNFFFIFYASCPYYGIAHAWKQEGSIIHVHPCCFHV